MLIVHDDGRHAQQPQIRDLNARFFARLAPRALLQDLARFQLAADPAVPARTLAAPSPVPSARGRHAQSSRPHRLAEHSSFTSIRITLRRSRASSIICAHAVLNVAASLAAGFPQRRAALTLSSTAAPACSNCSRSPGRPACTVSKSGHDLRRNLRHRITPVPQHTRLDQPLSDRAASCPSTTSGSGLPARRLPGRRKCTNRCRSSDIRQTTWPASCRLLQLGAKGIQLAARLGQKGQRRQRI